MLFDFLNDIKDEGYCKECKNLFAFCNIAEEKVYDEPSASMSNGGEAAEIILRFYSKKKGEKERLDKLADFNRYDDLKEAITREWKNKFDTLAKEQSNNDAYNPISEEEIESEAERFAKIIVARVKDNRNTAVHDKAYRKYYLGSLKMDGNSPRTEALNSLRDLYYIVSLSLKDLNLIDKIKPYQEPEWAFEKKEPVKEKEIKGVKLFLATSMEELTLERLELERFIRLLDKIFSKHGINLDLISRDNLSGDMSKEEINNEITKCQYFYAVIGNYADAGIVEEYNTAINSRNTNGIPKVYTYIQKTSNPTQSVVGFIKHVSEELGYAYSSFTNIDTVKLDFLMDLCRNYAANEQLCFEDGEAVFQGEQVLSLSNIPIYGNNEDIVELKEKKELLNSQFAKLCADYAVSPGNSEIYNRLLRVSEERAKVLDQFRNLEKDVFALYKDVSVYKTGETSSTWYEKEAQKQVEEGNYAGAIAILQDKEREKELEKALLLADAGLEQIELHIRENELLIKTLKSQKKTTETVEAIEHCYQESAELTKKYHLNNNVLYDYVCFLVTVDADYMKVISITQGILSQMSGENAEKLADTYQVIGEAYLMKGHKLKEGKTYYQMALDHYLQMDDSYKKYQNIVFCFSRLSSIARIEDNYEELHIITDKLIQLNKEHRQYISDYYLGVLYGICLHFYLEKGEYQSLLVAQQYAEENIRLAQKSNSLEWKSRSYSNLAEVYWSEKNYEKALEMRLTQYGELKKRFEEDTYDFDKMAISAKEVANALSKLHRYKDAVQYLAESVDYYRILTARTPLAYEYGLTSSLHNLGLQYENVYNYYDAEKAYREAYVRRKATIDRDDVYESEIIFSCRALAEILTNLDRYDEAEELYREALEIAKQYSKKDSSGEEYVRSSKKQLARNCLIDMHKFEEAEKILSELLEYGENHVKEESGNLIWYYEDYATLLWKMKRNNEAVVMQKKSLQLYGELEGGDKAFYSSIHAHNMAWILVEAGRYEEAFPYLEKERVLREELIETGRDDIDCYIASTYELRGEYFLGIDNLTESEICLKKALEIYEKLGEICPDAFASNIAETNKSYAKLMIKAKNREEAEKHCRIAIDLYTELEKKASVVYRDDLADAYDTFVKINSI